MDAEIAHRHPGRELAPDEIDGRLGEQNLTTVARRHDAGPLMQSQAGIAFLRTNRRPCMDAHAHANRGVLGPCMICQQLLGFGCGKHSMRRSLEDHEEGISLRIDLDTSVTLERTPHQLPMGRQ
jgi:hypothetical protein